MSPRLDRDALKGTFREISPTITKKFVRVGIDVFFNPGGKQELKHKTILDGEMRRAGVTGDPDDAGYFERTTTGEIIFKDESSSLGIGTNSAERNRTVELVQEIAGPEIKIIGKQSRYCKPS